jgi:hypothetical protein
MPEPTAFISCGVRCSPWAIEPNEESQAGIVNPAGIHCPLCGARNDCAVAQAGRPDAACWCTEAAIDRKALARIPQDQTDRACLCPRCAAGIAEPRGVP